MKMLVLGLLVISGSAFAQIQQDGSGVANNALACKLEIEQNKDLIPYSPDSYDQIATEEQMAAGRVTSVLSADAKAVSMVPETENELLNLGLKSSVVVSVDAYVSVTKGTMSTSTLRKERLALQVQQVSGEKTCAARVLSRRAASGEYYIALSAQD